MCVCFFFLPGRSFSASLKYLKGGLENHNEYVTNVLQIYLGLANRVLNGGIVHAVPLRGVPRTPPVGKDTVFDTFQQPLFRFGVCTNVFVIFVGAPFVVDNNSYLNEFFFDEIQRNGDLLNFFGI